MNSTALAISSAWPKREAGTLAISWVAHSWTTSVALLIERHAAALNSESDGRTAVEAFLRSIARMLVDPALPGGCFIINGSADCGGSTIPASVELALRAALQASESMLLERVRRAQGDGDLPAESVPEALAAMFSSLIAGLAVLAKSGVPETKLHTVIDTAMQVWPAPLEQRRKHRLKAA